MNRYIENIGKLKATEAFKSDCLLLMEREQERKRENNMKKYRKIIIGIAACGLIALGAVGYNAKPVKVDYQAFDLTERILVDADAPLGCGAVNIEGVIIEVAEDGLSFKLDNGKWVDVTEETEIGMTSPTAAAKEDQYFEPTFRIGNMIAGFTENEDSDRLNAYVIYTNWNWDDPIR